MNEFMDIILHNVSLRYGTRLILNDVNACFEAGKFFFLLGKNGSGKSTLLRILAGIEVRYNGNVYVGGKHLKKLGSIQRAKIIGYIGQKIVFQFPIKVFDVVLMGRIPHVRFVPGNKDRIIAEEALDKVGMRHFASAYFHHLSGGEQQLVLMARLLAQQVRVFLLDETLAHLDLHNQYKVLKMLLALEHEGITIILVVHDPNQALLYGKNVKYLHQGKLLDYSLDEPSVEILGGMFDVPLNYVHLENKMMVFPSI